MTLAKENHKHIVLVGGGHTHAILIKMWGEASLSNVTLTLISNTEETPYSGMLPGLVSGHYTFEETHINLPKLCRWAKITFICTEVTHLDKQRKSLTTSCGQTINYDLLSINIGSTPNTKDTVGAKEFSMAVKPIATFYPKWLTLKKAIQHATQPLNISLVGAGAGGFELISAIQTVCAGDNRTNKNIKHNVKWIISGKSILPSFNEKVQRQALRYCHQNNIKIHFNFIVDSVSEHFLHKKNSQEKLAVDEVIWCAAANPAKWPIEAGLDSDDKGFIAINDLLQTINDPCIFAVGDIATQINHPRPKAGVFAVRQGPPLYKNLRNAIQNQPLYPHIPQTKFLSILATGNKTAIASRGTLSVNGYWVWYWKNYIDLKFMNNLKQLNKKTK